MDSTRHQEILDRCWEALPEGCPMRQWDREQFDDVWGYWEPNALARVDPTCAIPESLLFVEIFAVEPDEEIGRAHKVWIAEHYIWLMCGESCEHIENWNSVLLKCRRNAEDPDKRLIIFIDFACSYLITMEETAGRSDEPLESSFEVDIWTQETQQKIKAQCLEYYPGLFRLLGDNDAWRGIVNNTKKHIGKIPADKAGRRKKN
jgi:hypothetical protein